jgi:hypothetical protein
VFPHWGSVDHHHHHHHHEFCCKSWGKYRPKLTWTEGIRELMGDKGLMEEDWNDRGNWKKKII